MQLNNSINNLDLNKKLNKVVAGKNLKKDKSIENLD